MIKKSGLVLVNNTETALMRGFNAGLCAGLGCVARNGNSSAAPGNNLNQSQLVLMEQLLIMLEMMMQGQQRYGGNLGQMAQPSDPRWAGGVASSGASGQAAADGPAAAPLSGSDQQTADSINSYFRSKNSPAASQDVGTLCVQLGKQYDLDPRILVAIAGQETNYGKAGIGSRGMLGVGAYDNDPHNATRNSHFSGVEQQLRVGAQTFAKLRAKGGATSRSSIDEQLTAVNRAGWASAQNWHTGVSKIFRQVAQTVR